jgi:hypothetical protein
MFNLKTLMLLLGGVAVAGVVWYSFLGGNAEVPLLQTEDLTAAGVQSEVVTTLLQLRAVSLSGTIFSDPTFSSLQDFGSAIVPEPVGRANPFAPLGQNAGAQQQQSTSTATTTRR